MHPSQTAPAPPASETSPYAAPDAMLEVPVTAADSLLYVVAPRKFLIMLIGTLGLYTIYWFYRNWAMLNQLQRSYWPIPRAIFNIFFAHALFREVDKLLKQRAIEWSWKPEGLATLYVLASVLQSVLDRVVLKNVEGWVVIVPTLLTIPVFWSLYHAQLAINAAESDPEGIRNRNLTALNAVWLLFGIGVWLLVIAGLVVTAFPDLLD